MKDKIVRKLMRSYWLGKKEKQILEDSLPWPRQGEPTDLEITVPVGPPYGVDIKTVSAAKLGEGRIVAELNEEDFEGMWANKNRLRIDVVARFGPQHVIAEVTPTVGAGSLGKIQLYEDWYKQDRGVSDVNVQPCLIGREHHESAEGFCNRHGIWLGDVPEGGPLNWVVYLG